MHRELETLSTQTSDKWCTRATSQLGIKSIAKERKCEGKERATLLAKIMENALFCWAKNWIVYYSICSNWVLSSTSSQTITMYTFADVLLTCFQRSWAVRRWTATRETHFGRNVNFIVLMDQSGSAAERQSAERTGSGEEDQAATWKVRGNSLPTKAECVYCAFPVWRGRTFYSRYYF